MKGILEYTRKKEYTSTCNNLFPFDLANCTSLAVQFALETTSLPSQAIIRRLVTPSATANPYILPFAMRGLLEEDYVRTDLYRETQQLLKQFDDWKPSSKALKDVKFRLEGIRSKL